MIVIEALSRNRHGPTELRWNSVGPADVSLSWEFCCDEPGSDSSRCCRYGRAARGNHRCVLPQRRTGAPRSGDSVLRVLAGGADLLDGPRAVHVVLVQRFSTQLNRASSYADSPGKER